MKRIGYRVRSMAVLGLLALAVCPAFAQTSEGLFVVCQDGDCGLGPDFREYSATEFQDAIDDATTLASNTGNPVTILVLADTNPYTGLTLDIEADADIRILGAQNTTATDPFDGPWQVVLQGSAGLPVFTIDASAADEACNRLIIEGLTIEGGSDGIQLTGDSTTDDFAPTLTRLNITDNDNGIRVQGDAAPRISNSTINFNNIAGVFVGDGIGGMTAFADILHCSIISNGLYGVFVEQPGNDARVRNTLVYQNGTSTDEGGIVWEQNPAVDPDEGCVDGGTTVTITGAGFVNAAGATTVYFGPESADTRATPVSAADDELVVTTPPSFTGAPIVVDITIVRGDGFRFTLERAFTYEGCGTDTSVLPIPYVTGACPQWGPIDDASTTTVVESNTHIYVYGARFDRDSEVYFDFNGNGTGQANERSPSVRWLSSGRLLVVPTPTETAGGPYDIIVVNPTSGPISPVGPLKEYEYRDITDPAPHIVSIKPAFSTDTQPTITATIFGLNFEDDCVVRIGGIICSYGSITPDPDPNEFFINDVVIPVALFGAGGSYDVEVTNPNGLHDIYPNAFTYFPNGEPDHDTIEWRVANFAPLNFAGARTLLGSEFETGISLTYETIDVPSASLVDPSAAPGYYLPDQSGGSHNGHSQREIDINFGGLPVGLGVGARVLEVTVTNVLAGSGPSTTAGSFTSEFYYTDATGGTNRARDYSVNSASILGTPPATPPNGRDVVQLDVTNWIDSMEIYVNGVLVTDFYYAGAWQNDGPGSNPNFGDGGDPIFEVPAQPEGVTGAVDIRVELPGNDPPFNDLTGDPTLYYILKDGYAYPNDTNSDPFVHCVEPNTIPFANNQYTITIEGMNFLGPAVAGENYTAIFLDDGNVATPVELTPPGAGNTTAYNVISGTAIEITFNPTTLGLASDTPISVTAQQSIGGTLSGTASVPLQEALIFVAAPTFTNLEVCGTPFTPLVPVVRNGPVQGGTPVHITGSGFEPVAGTHPRVKIGDVEALVDDATTDDNTINITTPPSPDGRPGTYDVTVITFDGAGDPHEYTLPEQLQYTYFMDGRPVITEISPNHLDFTTISSEQIFVTIYGYNFDDLVDVLFNGPDGDVTVQVNSVSPNKIVVEVESPELLADDPADFTGGLATVFVTVTNVTATDDATTDYTSDPVEFYLHNDSRGNIDPDGPELRNNDVFSNFADNYVNVVPGSGDFSVEPEVTDSPWVGNVEPEGFSGFHPLRDRGGDFTADLPAPVDFEGDARPDGNAPDVGADEIRSSAGNCTWYYCTIDPNPVGAVDEGDLVIEVRVDQGCEVQAGFIVPQGVDPINDPDAANYIPLSVTASLGNNAFLLTNDAAITTVLEEDLIDPLDGPSLGDVIADGHAAVCVITDSGILGDGGLTDGVTDQAVNGRHFLIDTVPPRMYIELYGGNAFENVVTADLLVLDPDDLTVSGNADPATHPFPLPSPVGITWTPETVPAPVDYEGGIALPVTDELLGLNGTKIFINKASIANNLFVGDPLADNLNITVEVVFIDPQVTVGFQPDGPEITGTDYWLTSGGTDARRQAAGFLSIEPLPNNSIIDGAGRWQLVSGAANFAGSTVTTTYDTDDNGNEGVFDSDGLPDNSVPDPAVSAPWGRNILTASWQIDNLDWNLAAVDTFRVVTEFIGEDLAGNDTTDFPDWVLDPLDIWWVLNIQSNLSPPRNGLTTANPRFLASLLERSPDPQAAGGPVPIYTYRVWVAATNNYEDTYNAVGGWSEWSPDRLIDLTGNSALLGRYVLLVVQAADEAGNVEPWDPLGCTGVGPDDPLDLTGAISACVEQYPNWQRFRIVGAAPDTRIEPNFYHVNALNGAPIPVSSIVADFGKAPLIPLPSDRFNLFVEALFQVWTARPSGSTDDIYVMWEFFEDGTLVSQSGPSGPLVIGPLSSDADVRSIASPVDVVSSTGFLGDRDEGRRAITYVFRATAFFDSNLNGGFDPATEVADPTPANVYFTVVPSGVATYVSPPDDADSQPFKEQELR